jgi:energy-coupling factor transporter ATP-binding protein EcfA2
MQLTEFRQFLGSFKNAESLSPELQAAIAVDTGLEPVVKAALREGRCVIIAGSAGSGKTHLVRSVVGELGSELAVARPGQRPRDQHILVVEDATELDAAERVAIANSASRSRVGTLLAINEGPLLEAARQPAAELLQRALRLLHRSHRGVTQPFDLDSPTVIDMGAFDPLASNVVTQILALPLLTAMLEAPECACDPLDCPRRRAWRQLRSATVRERLASTLRVVHALEREWLFRDLWDWVADLTLGGSCDDDPPTSPWFWRVFYGDSRLSEALRDLVSPDDVVLPRLDARIYYGDWAAIEPELLPETELIQQSSGNRGENDTQIFRYVKAQVLFLCERMDLSQQALSHVPLPGHNVGALLRTLNEYFAFGLRAGSEAVLDLFVEHAIERRSEHIDGVIKLGEAEAGGFALKRPQVVANHPDEIVRDGAGALFLVHGETESAFRVDGERLRLLRRGRTVRSADRAQIDLDWDLCQFFEGVLRNHRWGREFSILHCDFSRMTSMEFRYRASANPALVEEA